MSILTIVVNIAIAIAVVEFMYIIHLLINATDIFDSLPNEIRQQRLINDEEKFWTALQIFTGSLIFILMVILLSYE